VCVYRCPMSDVDGPPVIRHPMPDDKRTKDEVISGKGYAMYMECEI
jgi:hypothetical protein